ncbi:MAG TPA: DUF4239 domain-containing protein [Candidatus Binatia bacterium]|nr:DUF4239 domain-containing protein [Candidatus Binatia bacterium]
MMDWLQGLPLLAMFLVVFLITLAVALLIILSVRATLRRWGYSEKKPFALRDVVVTATSAMFALMIAFSAVGIWNDANLARAAVQREANALENVLSIAASFPPALRERVTTDVRAYAKQVLDVDWSAMVRKVHFTDHIYDPSEKILIDLVEAVAREGRDSGAVANASIAVGQVVEVRSARLSRITLATQGVSPPQWVAMLLIAVVAMIALAMIHNHDAPAQLSAMAIYAGAVAAAFFVILAHDRPFVGQISVGSQPIAQLLQHVK